MVANPKISIFCLAYLYFILYFFLPYCACSNFCSTLSIPNLSSLFSLRRSYTLSCSNLCSSIWWRLALRLPRIIINLIKLYNSAQYFDLWPPYYYFIAMEYSNKSALITQQTRYSEDIFNSGLKTIRKRINVLSSSSVFTPNKPYPT